MCQGMHGDAWGTAFDKKGWTNERSHTMELYSHDMCKTGTNVVCGGNRREKMKRVAIFCM